MLKKLSLRNAIRQGREYFMYAVTLVCSVAFMYSFNALIFSDSVKAVKKLDILPFMIITTSLLVIMVLGWIVNYMTNYMLKRRSRELSIYMLSGISNKKIAALFFYENLITGGVTFILGLLAGILISQLLEDILLRLFGLIYRLHFGFSPYAAALTFLYFLAVLLISLIKSRKWMRKVKLYDLLYYDRQNEQLPAGGKGKAVCLFLLSLLAGGTGFWLFHTRPWGKGYDVLAGFILLVVFQLLFFLSLPAFLTACLEDKKEWKYVKNRLVVFRAFTSKIRSMSVSMGVLSALFMLSASVMGIGAAAKALADRSVELNAFDIMILHEGEMGDFSEYEKAAVERFGIRAGHAYNIFQDREGKLRRIRDSADQNPRKTAYAEYRSDTYMKQSDYAALRRMLGYEEEALSENSYYIHCVPVLREAFEEQAESRWSGNGKLTFGGAFTEPFAQNDAYGNGLDYIAVIPDAAAEGMDVLYSLYAAVTEKPVSDIMLGELTETCEGLVRLNRGIARSVSIEENTITSLIEKDVDYLSGKWIQKDALTGLYSLLLCMFYFALILEIAAAAVLATQILNGVDKKRREYTILKSLGMDGKMTDRIYGRQRLLIFILPALPAAAAAGALILTGAAAIQAGMYSLPLFSGSLWTFGPLGAALGFFVLFYTLYYAAVSICETNSLHYAGRS